MLSAESRVAVFLVRNKVLVDYANLFMSCYKQTTFILQSYKINRGIKYLLICCLLP